ncbi:putative Dol-P-Glc:Glc(2)Man(9)GlcNAc(2)-PP-Dol alpha-1,2-glucosyltransferase [Bulinus truncatus]|nr:putative Dol-P-Glc:Glc(2)Man(9)GlcNAc(2)-PP-Dol alpha-1,2-glucosyltransferase [Bulinus truncatus]
MFGVNFTDICTTQNLRAFNLLFCAGNFILLYLLGKKLNGGDVTDNKYKNKEKYANQNLLLLNSSVLVLFPVLYFFSWFYYTDPGSTFFTLLLYAFCIHSPTIITRVSILYNSILPHSSKYEATLIKDITGRVSVFHSVKCFYCLYVYF